MLSKEIIKVELSGIQQEQLMIEVKDELDSTNAYLKRERLDPSYLGRICVANQQTATRGRFQRAYFAKPNQGIYFSLAFYVDSLAKDQPNFTVIAAVAVLDILEALMPSKDFSVKWVNDIYLSGKKVCGILAESVWDSTAKKQKVIVGIGINYSIQQDEFPEELSNRATSLFQGEAAYINRNEIIGKIIGRFFDLLAEEDGAYLERYRAHSFVIGRQVSFERGGQVINGQAMDVLADGSLSVLLENEELIALNSGEISLMNY